MATGKKVIKIIALAIAISTALSSATSRTIVLEPNRKIETKYVAIESQEEIKEEPSIQDIIKNAAEQYDVSSRLMIALASCESWLQPDIQSNVKKNGLQEQSFGLFQIHLPSHPEITKEQALNPYWASDWAAQQLKKGRLWKWKGSRRCWSPSLETIGE